MNSNKITVIVITVLLLVALGVTGPKLIKMCQIKGWLPGAEAVEVTISQKWNQTPDIHPSGRNTYWISWTERDIKQVGEHRTNVTKEKWDDMNIGDKIELLYIKGGSEPFLRDDIFVEPGSFVIDLILLTIEVGGAVILICQLIRNRRRQRNYVLGNGQENK